MLATNRHDPDWERQLQVLQRYTDLFQKLGDVTDIAIKQRLEPPAPPPPPNCGSWATELKGLKQMLEEHLRSGAVRSERAVAIRQTLEKMQAVSGRRSRRDRS